MKKIFAILPLFGAFGFFWSAYLFLEMARLISPWAYFAVAIFIICGLGFLIWSLKWLLKVKDESVSYDDGQILKTTGTKVIAHVVHLQHVTNIQINNRSPYIIHAKGINTINSNTEQIFKSFWLWSDPFVQAQAGRNIDIYLDKNNPKIYYLDVESIGLPAKS